MHETIIKYALKSIFTENRRTNFNELTFTSNLLVASTENLVSCMTIAHDSLIKPDQFSLHNAHLQILFFLFAFFHWKSLKSYIASFASNEYQAARATCIKILWKIIWIRCNFTKNDILVKPILCISRYAFIIFQ